MSLEQVKPRLKLHRLQGAATQDEGYPWTRLFSYHVGVMAILGPDRLFSIHIPFWPSATNIKESTTRMTIDSFDWLDTILVCLAMQDSRTNIVGHFREAESTLHDGCHASGRQLPAHAQPGSLDLHA